MSDIPGLDAAQHAYDHAAPEEPRHRCSVCDAETKHHEGYTWCPMECGECGKHDRVDVSGNGEKYYCPHCECAHCDRTLGGPHDDNCETQRGDK